MKGSNDSADVRAMGSYIRSFGFKSSFCSLLAVRVSAFLSFSFFTEKWRKCHMPLFTHSSMGHGSELHGTLKTVTHQTNPVKKEQTHYFGTSQLKQGSKAPDHRPTVAML